MRKLYPVLGILIICFGIISGCKTLFDVVPAKGISLPIDLKKITVSPPLIKQTFFPDLTIVSEYFAVINYTKTDLALSFGALAFYNSSEADAFVRERKIIGVPEPVSFVQGKLTNSLSATISYDNTKGQYIYVTPFAYKAGSKEDSIAIYVNHDYRKVFSSQGYIQLKISPWTYVGNLPGSKFDGGALLFPANEKLFCIKYDNNEFDTPGTIYGFESDTTKIQWIAKGSFANKVQTADPAIYVPSLYIRSIKDAYLDQNGSYHLFANSFAASPILTGGTIELVTPPNQFTINTAKTGYNDVQNTYLLINKQGDKLVTIKSNINNTSGSTLTLSSNKNSSFTTTEYLAPSSRFLDLVFIINSKLVYANSINPNTFNVYDLTNPSLKKILGPLTSSGSSQEIWSGAGCKALSISKGDSAYILNSLLNIYKVKLSTPFSKSPYSPSTPDNTPYFSSIYQGWFPANTARDVNSGFAFGNSLWFVINKNELWKINPDQLTTTFSRPGDVTPVYLYP
ncbi:hypothetical protein [Spirosoma jeollabukense]